MRLFWQVVSDCDPKLQKRTVTYILTQGSNSTCYKNPATMPPASILIDCSYVYAGSSVAGAAVAMCVVGTVVCAFILYLANAYSEEKVRTLRLVARQFVK